MNHPKICEDCKDAYTVRCPTPDECELCSQLRHPAGAEECDKLKTKNENHKHS